MTLLSDSAIHAWATVRFSTEPLLLLMTITHPEVETVRLVRNSTEDVESRGETFRAAWFEVDWVNNDGNVPRCDLSVPNIDYKEIGQRYFGLSTRPEVALEAVLASDPDTLVKYVRRLQLINVRPDPIFVTGTLQGVDHSSEPLGKIIVIPAKFSALFRRQRKT